jgi:hypothetical protein
MEGRETTTYVGFISPAGHNHDDNCVVRHYKCTICNHTLEVSKRNRCSVPGCNWVGKEDCGCCQGKKLDEWPE